MLKGVREPKYPRISSPFVCSTKYSQARIYCKNTSQVIVSVVFLKRLFWFSDMHWLTRTAVSVRSEPIQPVIFDFRGWKSMPNKPFGLIVVFRTDAADTPTCAVET
jgi:hypothetical protein